MKHTRWLITGASGFIGGAVARLAAQSGIRVGVMTRNPSPGPLPGEVVSGSPDAPNWQAIEAFKPDICIHCAWITRPGRYLSSEENPALARASIAFARGLFERGLTKFVGLGSCAEYAPGNSALEESSPRSIDPVPYVQAKLKTLDGITAASPCKDAFSWLRIFYPYGPGEPAGKFISSAITTLAQNMTLKLQRPADVVDYVYIDDVASAVAAVAGAEGGGIWNVGSGRPLEIREVARAVRAALGNAGSIEESGRPEPVTRFANIRRLEALGWAPLTDLEAGIRKMLSISSAKRAPLS